MTCRSRVLQNDEVRASYSGPELPRLREDQVVLEQNNAPGRVMLAAAALPLALFIAGCQALQPRKPEAQEPQSLIGSGVPTKPDKNSTQAQQVDVVRAPEHDDIFEIASLLPSNPWLRQS